MGKDFFIAILTLLLPLISFGENTSADKPNIIFILADDMGYGDVSILGKELSKIKTPNIDGLATQGVVFTDAHSSSSVCTPTRYSILTGRYNWRSTLKQGVIYGYSKALIQPGRQTIASMLKKQGYTTAAIGKWHLGWDWNNIDAGEENVDFSKPIENGPTTLGFDYFYGFNGSLDMPPYVYVENNMPTAIPNRETENKDKYAFWRKGPTAPDFEHEKALPNIISRACKYIEEKSKLGQPYFLYLPIPAPHTPILPTEKYREKSGLGSYGDFVIMVDDMVGRIVDAVEKSGKAKNTLIVFTSDNGCSPAAGIANLKTQGHYPNYIYRGHKADLFDGGHRIPCIVKWPKKSAPHYVNQTICLTDFYATFAAINGYKLEDSEGEDSYNILPLLESETHIEPIREATVFHSFYGQFTIRKGKWKLLLSPSSGGWSFPKPGKDNKRIAQLPKLQLYDMQADPSEKNNLCDKYPDVVNELCSLFFDYVKSGRSTPGNPQKNDGPESWKQLENI